MTTAALDRDLARLISSDPEAIADPFPLWNRLRTEAPFHRHDIFYMASRGRTVRQLFTDKRLQANPYARGEVVAAVRARLPDDVARHALDVVNAFEAMYMSRTDGEVHDRLRRIAQRTFTPRRIGLIRGKIESTAREMLAALPSHETVDLMAFAYRLPLVIVGEMLGVPDADLDMVHEWSNKLGRNRGGTDAAALMNAYQAMGEFRTYVEGRIEVLKSRPPIRREDEISLLADLLDAEQGEALSHAELTAMFVVLLFAGHETTTNLIGSGLLAMLQNDQWQRLVADPEIAPQAIEELLRFVSPVQFTGRAVREELEVEGTVVPAGATILLLLAAANRDPDIFPDPDRLDLTRAGVRNHLALGMGDHFCLGAPLARLEGAIAFQELARRFPDLSLADEPLRWGGAAGLRRLMRLPIRLGQARL